MSSTLSDALRLKVQQIEKVCLFELSWGRGQQLSATLPYPPMLTALYQEWRRVYLSFYETARIPLPAAIASSNSPETNPHSQNLMRGRAAESGSIIPPQIDWHARLVEAEAKLLYEFYRWLRSAELFDIRARIAQGNSHQSESNSHVEVFLTCTPLSLARFPWETWEMGTEFGSTKTIRIVRTPANIRAEASHTPPSSRRRKARILAILGDDTGLNFHQDQAAVRSLSGSAEVRFVGWQPGQTSIEVKDQISRAIADTEGWDVLFFAGHSNETQITGGELAIAPGTSIRISEIASQLTQAKERGLQFAIFNSCSGLSIAESLIDLGLSQVAVMREPIHNQVAQEFLVRFLQNLALHKDAHEALLAACQFLKLEKSFTYPSAYLLPSFFRHPDAILFRIQPFGWKQRLQAVLPTPVQAIAVTTICSLSLMPSVQDLLLDRRVWVQAIYRDLTHQLPAIQSPPVMLVQIDDKSIRLSEMSNPNPIDREYLASLIDRLVQQKAPIVGIDYLLDRQQPGKDQILGQSVRTAIAQQSTWFVFGAINTKTEIEAGIGEATGIADLNWSLQGKINSFPTYVQLPNTLETCREVCPFAYLLALLAVTRQESITATLPQPQLDRRADLRTQLLQATLQTVPPGSRTAQLRQTHFHPITNWSSHFDQLWLRPIIDYSIPSDRAYDRLSAWELLADATPDLSHLTEQVVIIAPGGYAEAGVGGSEDSFPMPGAMAYWRDRLHPEFPPILTGAEAHAYMIYHLLNRNWVMPIPDLWMVAVAILFGKGAASLIEYRQRHQPWSRKHRRYFAIGLGSATVLYGLFGLQVYVSAGLLFPWLLPSSIFWIYALLVLRKKTND